MKYLITSSVSFKSVQRNKINIIYLASCYCSLILATEVNVTSVGKRNALTASKQHIRGHLRCFICAKITSAFPRRASLQEITLLSSLPE